MSERIALVMTSFGRSALLAGTLKTLTETTDRNLVDVTVVDNGSGQKTIDVLMQYRENVIAGLVLLNENMGKPYAWNLGARIAAERCAKFDVRKPDYFLFCDSDLRFLPGWLHTLLTTYKEHEHLDKKPLCGLSGLSWPKHQLDVKTGPTTSINVYRFPPGCCVFISAAAFKANGNWDTRRLIRTVDTSYFRNALRRGYRNASVHPDSVIEHTGGRQRSWDGRTGEPKLFI